MLRRALAGALVLLASVASPLDAQVPLGFITGPARDTLVADWTDQPDANERAYCVDADSVPQDWSPDYRVVYVTRVHRLTTDATPMSVLVDTLCHGRPVIHTHAGYCRVGPWGPERSTCSSAAPEAFQCQPSRADLALLLIGGEEYDVIQCGRVQFRFYWNVTSLLGGTPHAGPHHPPDRGGERATLHRDASPRTRGQHLPRHCRGAGPRLCVVGARGHDRGGVRQCRRVDPRMRIGHQMPDDQDPAWLREHNTLYGWKPIKRPAPYTTPKPGENPQFDLLWAEAVRYAIDTVLAEMTDQHTYYTRRCVLPAWKPGDGLELA